VLLRIFYLIRLDIQDEEACLIDSNWDWGRQRWWYKPAQVCQRWRSIIFESPSRLDLHLLCTYGTPIADMLTHSPPLPLTIYYHSKNRDTTTEDEEGIRLALQLRDRLRRIRLALPASSLRRIITDIDGPFPILERLYILSRTNGDTSLVLRSTFQAPLLRDFALQTVAVPIGSPFLITRVGLVILCLEDIPSSAYFPPSYLLTRLSLMPQLEKLVIRFRSPLPSLSIEPQLSRASVMADITLSHLRIFHFKGMSTYLEGLLAWIRSPLLRNFAN
jgi:hypothetical protein